MVSLHAMPNASLLSIRLIIDLYEGLAIALFFGLTWLASECIQLVTDDVETYSPALYVTYEQRLKKWKRSYCLISNFVEEIERFFETLLFQLIVRQFCLSFFFVSRIVIITVIRPDGFDQQLAVLLAKNAVLTSAVIFGSQMMKQKVRRLIII